MLSASLQFPLDKVGHQLVEVQAGVAAVDAVVLVGIDAHLELLIGLLEGGDEVEGVLEVDVIVARTVDKQIVALQPISEVDGRIVVVAVGVVLRTLQEALGVDVVVIAPCGDGCHSYGTLEDIVAFQYA